MTRRPTTVYLERRTYRRRRMMDAARLLPILGVLLFLVPLFWATNTMAPAMTASGVIFLFVVWAVLILIAGLLARWLNRPATEDPDRTRSE